MSYGYNLHSELYEANKSGQRAKDGAVSRDISYDDALRKIRKILTDSHAEELRQSVETEQAAEHVKALISKYVHLHRMSVTGIDKLADLVDRIYDDMLGFSFLTSYIYDPTVEEINANRFDFIEVIYPDRYEILKEKFPTPTHCADLAKRMALLGGVVVDGAKPIADSYITRGVRIHVELPPIVDADAGAIISIRKQSKTNFTRDDYIRQGTATEEIMDFLQLAASHGVSIGFAGATGSGKTTDLKVIGESLPISKRIDSIEEGSRELDLTKYDGEGNILNRVLYRLTRQSDDPRLTYDSSKLAIASLRLHPDIIIMAEMRGKEAINVQEAGRTGQQILTTFHANSAKDAYTRYQSMCVSAQSGFPTNDLLCFCYQSIPIMCFKETLEDGRRKFTQIVEAVKVGDGYQIVTLFEFIVTGHRRDDNGRILETIGEDRHVNRISNSLAYFLNKKGAPLDVLRRFARDDYDPAVHGADNDEEGGC